MSRAPRLRGAILGYGHVASEQHMPVWTARADVEIVAAADAAQARRDLFLAACPGGRTYATAEALLAAERLDFVDVCTPPSSHAALVGQALDAGLHVLCEKPLTVSAEEARRLAAHARAVGRVVCAVHNWMAAPVCRKVQALIAEGAVGSVTAIRWATLRTRPAVAVGGKGEGEANWRLDPKVAGGGILFDHGWHAAYCLARWAGADPVRLSARLESRRFHALAVEDTATVELDFGDIQGQIHLSWAADQRANTISVEGERGRIEAAGAEVALLVGDEVARWDCPPSLSDGSHHPDWFAAEAAAFLAAVSGAAAGNLAEAVMCAEVMGAAMESSRQAGAWVPLAPRA